MSTTDYVTIKKAAELTGLTEKAIRHNIEDGVWLEGEQWRRAPNNRLFVSIQGYHAWVEKGVASRSTRRAFASA